MASRTQTARNKRASKEYQEETVITMFLDGWLLSEIATELGIRRSTAERIIINRGYNPQRFRRFEGQDIEEWVAKYNGDWDGFPWSVNQIAIDAECSWGTVAVRLAERVGRLRHRSKSYSLTAERKRAMKKKVH